MVQTNDDPLFDLKELQKNLGGKMPEITTAIEVLTSTMKNLINEKPIKQKNFKDEASGLGCAVTLFEKGKLIIQFPNQILAEKYFDNLNS